MKNDNFFENVSVNDFISENTFNVIDKHINVLNELFNSSVNGLVKETLKSSSNPHLYNDEIKNKISKIVVGTFLKQMSTEMLKQEEVITSIDYDILGFMSKNNNYFPENEDFIIKYYDKDLHIKYVKMVVKYIIGKLVEVFNKNKVYDKFTSELNKEIKKLV